MLKNASLSSDVIHSIMYQLIVCSKESLEDIRIVMKVKASDIKQFLTTEGNKVDTGLSQLVEQVVGSWKSENNPESRIEKAASTTSPTIFEAPPSTFVLLSARERDRAKRIQEMKSKSNCFAFGVAGHR